MKKTIVILLSLVFALALALSVTACDTGANVTPPPTDEDGTYSVYLNNNYPSGGRTVQAVLPGGKVTRPADPTREGYVFAGWYDEYEDGEPYDFESPVNGNLRLYAYWNNSAYFVTFKYNNDSADRVESVATNTAVVRPADPERDDYEFSGWYTDAANTKPYDFSTPVSSSFSLYAGWTRSSVSATFNLNYTGSPTALILNVKVDTAITIPETFDTTRRLYALEGWYDKAYPTADDEPYDLSEGISDDVTLYAKWTRTAYLITFNPNVLGMANVEVEVPVETGVAEVPDFKREGHTLDTVWYTAADGTTSFDLTSVHDDAMVFGKWTVNSYNVDFDLNYDDSPEAPDMQSVVYQNFVTRPTAPERDGYLFLGWFTEAENGTSFNFEATGVKGSFTLYAHWQENQAQQSEVTVTFLYNNAYVIVEKETNTYSSVTIDYSTALTDANMPADPTLDDKYMFLGWYKEKECVNKFSPADILVADTNVFARILQENRFEAEYVNLKDIHGAGSSVELNEEAMIFNYKKIGNATGQGVEAVSNDYYVAGMYQKGLYIEFEIFASRDISNAVFQIRVSSEFKELHFNPLTPETYRIDVVPKADYEQYAEDVINNVDVQTYIFNYELPLTLPLPNTERESDPDGEKTPFSLVTISYKFSMKAGDNVIRLTTNNEWNYGAGTFRANAPMIDYISIFAEGDVSLLMEEYEEFLLKSAAYQELNENAMFAYSVDESSFVAAEKARVSREASKDKAFKPCRSHNNAAKKEFAAPVGENDHAAERPDGHNKTDGARRGARRARRWASAAEKAERSAL
ncbi:MAG: InlB B-repeat-containing protein [Clostridia bacterium]|nr:InlB B-repeat-containing protein [Clostridia bacterium]